MLNIVPFSAEVLEKNIF